jgi:carboxypeptidase C (cathepsin A)
MKNEKPILFSEKMIQAILDGRKTQTRRVIKPQPPDNGYKPSVLIETTCKKERKYEGKLHWIKMENEYTVEHSDNNYFTCPYGKPGDLLWVRENFTITNFTNDDQSVLVQYDDEHREWMGLNNDEWQKYIHWKNRTGRKSKLFMFRSLSRIQLQITDIRVERVQDISEQDALAEGCSNDVKIYTIQEGIGKGTKDYYGMYAQERFRNLWDSINEERGFGWDENPWVWKISFELC